jgi:hypothetical protein
MAQPQLIINFNRYIEPNAFNTGPAIPTPSPSISPNEIHSPLPQLVSFHPAPSGWDVPELSTSPASTISSTSLKLEDEEIKRIFSHPRFTPSHDTSYNQQQYTSFDQEFHASYSPDSIRKEDLNPHAAPFVPSSILPGSQQKDAIINDTHSSLPTQQTPPHYPPGLPLPAACLWPPSVFDTHMGAVDQPSQPDPKYLPNLHDFLNSSTTPSEREALVKVIVNSTAIWDIENLLALAESLCAAACNSAPNFDEEHQAMFTCHFSRYLPVNDTSDKSDSLNVEVFPKPDDVAAVAAELQRQFSNLQGEEVAQAFVWNMREVVLMQFINSWDCVSPPDPAEDFAC